MGRGALSARRAQCAPPVPRMAFRASVAHPAPSSNDHELIVRLRRRDPRALAELVSHHFDNLVAFSMRRLGDPKLAHDVAEAVFVAAWRGAALFKEPVAIANWLFGIAQFKCAALLGAADAAHPQ